MTTLATKLAAARRKSGKSQDEVAKALGVAQPTISGWEQGSIAPRPDKWRQIARVYGVPLSAFVPSEEGAKS